MRDVFVSRLPAGRLPAASLQGAHEELQPVRAAGQQRLPQSDRPLQLQPAADHGCGKNTCMQTVIRKVMSGVFLLAVVVHSRTNSKPEIKHGSLMRGQTPFKTN